MRRKTYRSPRRFAIGPTGGLTLDLSFSGTLSFSQDAANDMGDYVGPFVHQKCFMQRGSAAVATGSPPQRNDWTVFFRPDADGSRFEVVVELGTVRNFSTPAHRLTPYTATIKKAGVTLAVIIVPTHYWWSRWRWQSAPRPFVRAASDLFTAKLIPPMTSAYLYGYSPWTSNFSYSGPMGNAGLSQTESDTGDRDEIGLLTLAQADYLLLGTALAGSSMMAQAEASGSMPHHIRDELTGAPFDVQAHPYMTTNQGAGQPFIIAEPSPQVPPGDSNYFQLDSAHIPTLGYVPFLLTDDPYYLEECQFQSNYDIVEEDFHTFAQQLPGLVSPSQDRSTAWGLRDMGYAIAATPASVPSWLKPKSYFTTNLADNRTFLQRFQNSPARVHSYFRAYPRGDTTDSFQDSYLCIALAMLCRLGHSEWLDGLTWKLGATLELCSGDGSATHWKKGWPSPYYLYPLISDGPTWGVGSAFSFTLITDTSMDANTYASWSDMFASYCAGAGGTADPSLTSCPNPPWDGTSIMQTQSNAGYFTWRAGALHMAVGLGVTGAAAASTWIDSQIPATITRLGGTSDPRFSIDITA